MKRSISDRRDQYENLTMANCLMFLSRSSTGVIGDHFEYSSPSSSSSTSSPSRVFECKTCNRQFPSFQALGGHRASHKKPRLAGSADSSDSGGGQAGGSPAKPKTHECTICGLEFAIGQALGGHMRRHRATMADQAPHHHHHQVVHQPRHPLLIGNISNSMINMASNNSNLQAPVVKKISNNGGATRVLCLDLNLTPLENDIKILQLGNPLVNIF